ncbi:MAG: TolC family protein, partial [Muribaculaceae bacterium]|nr:TolC family protein [Muribaculaceae bacterium]
QQKNVARASMLPNLALIGAYSFSNPNLNDGFKKKFGGGFSVGVALTVPIWHWGGNYAKYKAAESAQVISRLQLADARDMVELQVNQALQQTQEAYTTYEMTSVNLKKADENLRTATLAYKEGVATPNNVMEAQTAWLKAHSEQIDAMVGVRLCDTYLRKALGTLAY